LCCQSHLLGVLAGNDEWEDIYDFAVDGRETLENYLELKNGIPSHDTMRALKNISFELKF